MDIDHDLSFIFKRIKCAVFFFFVMFYDDIENLFPEEKTRKP